MNNVFTHEAQRRLRDSGTCRVRVSAITIDVTQTRDKFATIISRELKDIPEVCPVGEVYTWGNGSNYQLGSGAEGLQETPARLEALHELDVRQVVAAKFHSMALTKDGQLYSWGYGRGGRLGANQLL